MTRFCGNCFQEALNDQGLCTVCGFDGAKNKEKYPLALPAGSILNGRYIIGRVLGQGGFGITYTARDHQTGEIVAIKEFFPDSMVTRNGQTTVTPLTGERGENFAYGKDTFLLEAKTMAEFIGNPNIVRVYSYFEENGTGYFVMEYVDGQSFQSYLKSNYGRISWEDALRVILPVADALSAVHAKGIIHRDIAPDNICIAKDGTIKLLDFGAARYSLGNVSQSLDIVLRHGFAPKEQYKRHGRQGPYTDIYALGATLYYAITGVRPDDAIERLDEDTLPLPSTLGAQITEAQENVILKAMAVQPEDRYQSVKDFKAALTQPASRPVPKPVPKPEPKPAPRPDPKPESAPVSAPKAKLPKWLIPAGAALAAVVLGMLLGAGLGGKEEKNLNVVVLPTEQEAVQETEATPSVNLMGAFPKPEDVDYYERGYTRFWGQENYKRSDVQSLHFQDTIDGMPGDAWDVSANGDGSVMAWMLNGNLTVAANGTIVLNPDSSGLFYSFLEMTELDFGDCVDTSQVTNMNGMFEGCQKLEKLDVSSFDTSKVTNMRYMFNSCREMTKLDVSGFDTSKVTDMLSMFAFCGELTELDVSGFDTSNVTDMFCMFASCSSLTELDVSGFDTSRVTDMENMFGGCFDLTELDVSGFDTSRVTNMSRMFSGCYDLTELDVSNFDTSRVTTMYHMFSNCEKITTLDVANFNTSNVTNMWGLFKGCSSLTSLNLSSWNTEAVTDMSDMFNECRSLSNLDISSFRTSKVTSMGRMFADCNALVNLNISGFSSSSIVYKDHELAVGGREMSHSLKEMFLNCSKLKKPKCSDKAILAEYKNR